MRKSLLLIIILVKVFQFGQAATIYSLSNGHWNDVSTWVGLSIPSVGDDVVINGHAVIIDDTDGDVTVNSITLSNSLTLTPSKLTINGTANVSVNSFTAYIGINYQDVELGLGNSTVFTVNQDVVFHRVGANNTDAKLQLFMTSKAVMRIMGDFTFQYDDSGNSENNPEISMYDSTSLEIGDDLILQIKDGVDLAMSVKDKAQLTVGDSLIMEKSGGNDLLLYADSNTIVTVTESVLMSNSGGTGLLSISANQAAGMISVGGNLNITSTLADQITGVELNLNSVLDVDGDVLFRGDSESDVYLTLNDNSKLNLGGRLNRSNAYGSIFMSNGSKLVYDGTGTQQIACSDMPGSGTDNFICSNVEFKNTSGIPITLEGPWTINRYLDLTNGIIVTADTALLIIADGASISGGNSKAYVEGPMVKQGTSVGSTFLFPVGHNGVYAPIEIAAVTDPLSEYQAQYFSCPPPIEDGMLTPIENVSGQGFWSLSKSAGAKDVGVTLHWDDALAAGINNPDSLLIAGLTDNGLTRTWNSYGNYGTTGGTGNGVSGAIASNYSEPPPLDEVTLLTLGSTNMNANALPVILVHFTAKVNRESIALDWMTVMEEESDYFAIERSADGQSFYEIGQVMALGTHNGPQGYDFTDIQPLKGFNYYRLKQVDLNGNYMYSPVISAAVRTTGSNLYVQPTLVQEQVEIGGFTQNSGQLRIEVYHQTGIRVYQGLHNLENGVIQLLASQLNLNQTGMYHVVIYDGREVKSTRIIKVE